MPRLDLEPFKERIRDLYLDQKLTLPQLRARLAPDFKKAGFVGVPW